MNTRPVPMSPSLYLTTLRSLTYRHPFAAFVTVPDHERQVRAAYRAHDWSAYAHIIEHGDGRREVSGLVRSRSTLSRPGSGLTLLSRLAEHEGANYVECLGTPLAVRYASVGFVVVEVLPWDDRLAPDGWNYSDHGRPSYYRMALATSDVEPERRAYGLAPAEVGA